jgi:hypothetical protein
MLPKYVHVTTLHDIADVNGSNFDREIISGCDNCSNDLEAITFLHCAKALYDNEIVT